MDNVPFPEFFYQTIADEFEGLDNPHDIARRPQVVFDELLAGTDLRGRRVLDAGKLVRRAGAVASSRGVVGDACNLRFKDDGFEIVISSEMIEHTSRPPGAIRERSSRERPAGTRHSRRAHAPAASASPPFARASARRTAPPTPALSAPGLETARRRHQNHSGRG